MQYKFAVHLPLSVNVNDYVSVMWQCIVQAFGRPMQKWMLQRESGRLFLQVCCLDCQYLAGSSSTSRDTVSVMCLYIHWGWYRSDIFTLLQTQLLSLAHKGLTTCQPSLSYCHCYTRLLHCWSRFYQLRQLRPAVRSLTADAAKTLISAFILCCLGHCNSLLCGVSDSLIRKLQSVQNAAACLITGARRCDHITPVLELLHWLPVRRRVDYEVACLVY